MTKLGKAEADKLAKDWTNKGLSNRQIVDQLKKHFASTGDTSSERFGDLIILYSSNL
jgi:hypothetical protein